MDLKDFQFHPACVMYPMIEGQEFQDLVESMRAVGFDPDQPIAKWRGMVLDGRNRLRAALEAGVEPLFRDIPDETNPYEYAKLKNLHRRHLSVQQRAIIAAQTVNASIAHAHSSGQITIAEAARLQEISEASVKRAQHILQHGCTELIQAVRNDEIGLEDGMQLSRKHVHTQRAALKSKGEDRQQMVRGKRKLVDQLGDPIPPSLSTAFFALEQAQTVYRLLDNARRQVDLLHETSGGTMLDHKRFQEILLSARKVVRNALPHAVCPQCQGIKKNQRRSCPCQGRGWLSAAEWDAWSQGAYVNDRLDNTTNSGGVDHLEQGAQGDNG